MDYEQRIETAESQFIEIRKHPIGLITPIIGTLIIGGFYNLFLFYFPFFRDGGVIFTWMAILGNGAIMLILALNVVRWYYNRYYAKDNTLIVVTPFSTAEINLIGRRFEIKQGIFDKIFNKGTIVLSDAMSSADDNVFILRNIKDPYETIDKIAHDKGTGVVTATTETDEGLPRTPQQVQQTTNQQPVQQTVTQQPVQPVNQQPVQQTAPNNTNQPISNEPVIEDSNTDDKTEISENQTNASNSAQAKEEEKSSQSGTINL